VAGVLRNGDGPAVMVRADMDALPVREETGLDYASDVVAADARGERTHVMHACGHDMHVTCLCGATAELAATTDTWRGTPITLNFRAYDPDVQRKLCRQDCAPASAASARSSFSLRCPSGRRGRASMFA
jgi:metal-dependent amidase/aminoacylase/carboxypeptidase family protein